MFVPALANVHFHRVYIPTVVILRFGQRSSLANIFLTLRPFTAMESFAWDVNAFQDITSVNCTYDRSYAFMARAISQMILYVLWSSYFERGRPLRLFSRSRSDSHHRMSFNRSMNIAMQKHQAICRVPDVGSEVEDVASIIIWYSDVPL